MPKELFDGTLITIEPDNDDRIAFGQPGIPGSKNILWSYLKQLLQGVLDFLDFNTGLANPTYVEGRGFYDDEKKAWSYYNDEPDITVNTGQEILIPVYNDTGDIITNGSLVYPTGTFGDKHTIGLANAHLKEKSRLVAMATHDIGIGSSGYATRIGSVGGVNTVGLSGILYLSAITDGEYTTTIPTDGSYIIPIGAVKEIGASGSITMDPYISELTVEVTDTNGFPLDQKEGTTISKVDGTRTFTIAPTVTEFHFYELGDKYEKTASENIIWTDVEGEHWFYYDSGVLSHIANPSAAQKEAIILNNAFISFLYWNAVDKKTEVDIFEERHGISMSPQTHLYLHLTRGAQYLNGLSLGDIISDGNGSLDTHAQWSMSSGAFFDEDITNKPNSVSVGDTVIVVYNSGVDALMRTDEQADFAVLNAPASRLYYNENNGGTWQLTEVTNNNFVLYHIFAVNGVSIGTVAVMGQNEYGNLSSARAGASSEISSLLSQLPFAEMIPLGTIIYQTSDSYSNTVLARIRTKDTGEDYIDWRTSEISQGTTASSHNNLTNLDLANTGVTWGHIDDQAQTIFGEKTFNDDLKSDGQAHGGHFIKSFSASATFDAEDGNNQEMEVTTDTTIAISNELPGTYIITLEINSVTAPVITIGASLGTAIDDSKDFIDADNDINIITLVVRPDTTKYYSISTITA